MRSIVHFFRIMASKEEKWTLHPSSTCFLVQVYVDDIIFDSTNESLGEDFSRLMHTKFKMSMMGELKFFLGI